MILRLCCLLFWLLAVNVGAVDKPGISEGDAVVSFKSITAKFPKRSAYAKGGDYTLQEPVIDVKKSDSLINPATGTIDCTIVTPNDTKLPMRFEFLWNGAQWSFSKLINRQSKRDFTDLPGGRAILDSEQIRAFLEPYRQK